MFLRCRFSTPKTTWAYIAILAVVVVGAMMREINLLIILAGLLAGPLLMSWQLIRLTLGHISVSRRLPAGVFPGQTFMVEFSVQNNRKRLDSWALAIEDRVRNTLPGKSAESKNARCLLTYLPAKSLRHANYRARLTERGRYRFGPLNISTGVPVGLLRGQITLEHTGEMFVYPKIGQLKSSWSDLAKYDQLGQRSWRRQQGPVEGDFYGLRDWRPGDSRRWIHWRSSAKRQELVVRQFEQHRSQDLVILLDLFAATDSDDTGDEQHEYIEQAISFVATVLSEHCRRRGGRLTLGVAGQEARLLRGTASSALLNDALEILADASQTAQDPLPSILPEVLAGTTAGDRILIVAARPTDLTDSARFPVGDSDESHRARLQQAICVDVSRPEFADLFSRDDTDELTTSKAE